MAKVKREDPDVVRVIVAWQSWKQHHGLDDPDVCDHSRALFTSMEQLSVGSTIPPGLVVNALIELEEL